MYSLESFSRLLLKRVMRWVRVDHPFSFLALCCSIFYIFLFPFFYMHLSASFSPRLCEKNRKSWPALQHRFIYIFFFFCRRFLAFDWLASDPSCSGFSSPSISFWSNGLPAILTKWRNRPFIVILSADRLFAKRNILLTEEVQRDTPVRSCISRRLIREIQKFQLLPFNLKIISQEIYICKFKISLSL